MGHDCAVGEAGCVNPLGVDARSLAHVLDDGPREAYVVDLLLVGAAAAPAPVPRLFDSVGERDDEAALVGGVAHLCGSGVNLSVTVDAMEVENQGDRPHPVVALRRVDLEAPNGAIELELQVGHSGREATAFASGARLGCIWGGGAIAAPEPERRKNSHWDEPGLRPSDHARWLGSARTGSPYAIVS